MDIQTIKIEFVKEFLKLENKELIILLDKLLRSNKYTKGNELSPMTIAELNKRIDKSLDDSNKDKLSISSDLIAEIEKWG